ncbi:DUF421 domain-containing protein [Metallumcola ferriviriculae]|uniref:DUF421 domain-containing protein n=1 Tax=Metallumcola ferriviriculae TaxID=3039180 RepID=A0AAU0ULL3_9FIRM|nr:DUF421 domain-containing protein [Desulfitibacteraceae bacterium MK1]
MLIVFFRAVILFAVVVLVMRLMGKRQFSQLHPYELVISLMIAELASVPMEDKEIPLLNGLVPIFTLFALQVILSYLTLKSQTARAIICGTPSILIENGKIVDKELRHQRYNVNDLLEQLRAKNMPNIADVEYAILETTGELTVIPRAQKRPINPDDMEVPTEYEGLPLDLVMDGQINQSNLHKAHLSKEWLHNLLEENNFPKLKEVLLVNLDTTGQIYIQPKNGPPIIIDNEGDIH